MSNILPPIAIIPESSRSTTTSAAMDQDSFEDCPKEENAVTAWVATLSPERRARFLNERRSSRMHPPPHSEIQASSSRLPVEPQSQSQQDRKRKRDATDEEPSHHVPITQAPIIDSEGEDELEDDEDAEADEPDESSTNQDTATSGANTHVTENASGTTGARIPALRRARPPTTSTMYTPPPRNPALTATIVLGDEYDGEHGDALPFKVGQRELAGTWFYVQDWKKQKTWPTDEIRPETVPVVFQSNDDPEAVSNLDYGYAARLWQKKLTNGSNPLALFGGGANFLQDTNVGCLACQISNLPCVQDYAQVKKCWRCETSRQCCTLQYTTYGHPDAGGIPNRFLASAKKVGVAWRHDQYVLLKKREKCKWIPVYFQAESVDERAKKVIQARVARHSGTVERAAKKPRPSDNHHLPESSSNYSMVAPPASSSPGSDVNHQHHQFSHKAESPVSLRHPTSPRNNYHPVPRRHSTTSQSHSSVTPETPPSVRQNLLATSKLLGEAAWSLFSGTGLDGPRSLHEECREIALKVLEGQRELDRVIRRLGEEPVETEGRRRMDMVEGEVHSVSR